MLKSLTVAASALAVCAISARAEVATNKEIVIDMVTEVFGARDVSAVDRYFAEDYIQRNPMVPSGSAVIKEFIRARGDAPDAPPNKRHRIIGEGDLVATHSTLYGFGPVPLVAFDIFRIEDGRIAEHWDVIAPIQTENLPDGYPGKF